MKWVIWRGLTSTDTAVGEFKNNGAPLRHQGDLLTPGHSPGSRCQRKTGIQIYKSGARNPGSCAPGAHKGPSKGQLLIFVPWSSRTKIALMLLLRNSLFRNCIHFNWVWFCLCWIYEKGREKEDFRWLIYFKEKMFKPFRKNTFYQIEK